MYSQVVLLFFCANFIYTETSQNILVNIDKNTVENVISEKFISFSVASDILLQNNDETKRNECTCMAKSLSPTYVQFNGPPIKRVVFDNENLNIHVLKDVSTEQLDQEILTNEQLISLEVWSEFMNWTKTMKIAPVIKLDSSDRLLDGKWNTQSIVEIFSVADKYDLEECVWKLDYDCDVQPLDRYINDLKTLKILVDTFPYGKSGGWKIVTGDLVNCLQEVGIEKLINIILNAGSLVDAINFDSLPDDILQNLSESKKNEIKHGLLKYDTQLWKKSNTLEEDMIDSDAFEWLKTLGNSAKQGYSVIFKDLKEVDLSSPTLSYYISLLHKKFVGPEVLNLTIQSDDSAEAEKLFVYGHCGTLPNGKIQDGITLFAINEGDSLANVTFDLSLKEHRGEIMQFVLQTHEGKVFVNGEEMLFEGDLQPLMDEVQSSEAMHVLLPPKAIGFWIVTNTDIEICSTANNFAKKSIYKNLKHKQLQANEMAKLMNQVLLDDIQKENYRNKRSTEDVEKSLEDSWEISEETLGRALADTKASGPFSNYTELFTLLGKLTEMLQLEKQFLEIGNLMLNSNETMKNKTEELIEAEYEKIDSESLKPLIRVIRNLEEVEITTEIKSVDEKTHISENEPVEEEEHVEEKGHIVNKEHKEHTEGKIYSVDKPHPEEKRQPEEKNNEEDLDFENISQDQESDDGSKLSPLKMPKSPSFNLDETKQTLNELIEKARNLMKSLNGNSEQEDLNSSKESAPLVSLPGIKNPEVYLKAELLKSKLKLKELQKKIKARIAEINLKSKIKFGLGHKTVKRDVEEESSSIERIENFKKDLDFLITKNKLKKLIGGSKMWKNEIKNKVQKNDGYGNYRRYKRFVMVDNLNDDIENFISDTEVINQKENKSDLNDDKLNLIDSEKYNSQESGETFDFEIKTNRISKTKLKENGTFDSEKKVNSSSENEFKSIDCMESNHQIENVHNVPRDFLSWNDFTDKFSGIEETEDTFTTILDNINNFFSNMKRKFQTLWKNLTNN